MRAPRSLRRYLLAGILVPVLGLIALNTASLYAQALAAVNTAYDRTLLASAKVIGEQLDVEGYDELARVRATVPYSALEAFEADNRSRLFYRVSSLDGEMISGFAELPFWRGQLPQRPPYAALVDFYDARMGDEEVRVAILLQPVVSVAGRGMVVIQVAETLQLRRSLARQILIDTAWRQALLVAVIAFVVVLVVQAGMRPVRRLGAELGVPSDLVDHFCGRAGQPVGAQLGRLATDRGGSAPDLGLVGTHTQHQRVGPGQCPGVAALFRARLAHPRELRRRGRLVDERQVELVRVAGRELGRTALAEAAHQHRWGRLHRLGQGGRVREPVVHALELEPLPRRGRPEPGDDRQLLLEPVEPLGGAGERDAVRRVLGLEPAGADAELDAPAAHPVDVRDRDRQRPGQPERRAGHHRAEPDRAGLAGQAGQRHPGVAGARQPLGAHAEVVVGAEEGPEAETFGLLGDPHQVVVGGSLLGFGEDAQLHGRQPVRRGQGPRGRTPRGAREPSPATRRGRTPGRTRRPPAPGRPR